MSTNRTVFVIGSNSFSGSDLIDHLLSASDYNVIGVSRSPEKSDLFLPYKKNANQRRFRYFQYDVNHDMAAICALLAVERPMYVVNFAAQSEVAPSWVNPEEWFQTNAVAVSTLTNFLRKQLWLEKYVHISSPEVYGTCDGAVTEDANINPTTPYAASKAAGDLVLLALAKTLGFRLVLVRSTNVYGAHQQLHKIIPRAAIYLRMKRPIDLHGGGEAVKSFIHIRDVSRGEQAIMERGRVGEIYHIAPDAGVRVRQVVEHMCGLRGADFKAATRFVEERPGQDRAYVIDSSKARSELGWKPTIELSQGISELVSCIDLEWERIQSSPLEYVDKP